MNGPGPDLLRRLEPHLRHVRRVILDKQNPVTGLLPASTDVNEHGDYTDAWVRDNVYSILAPWGVALAYRRAGVDGGPVHELEGAVAANLRGLLRAMMRQAPKVEAFKRTQDPLDALHAKYGTATGAPVVPDEAWGHLQIDATSLFLLALAQATAGGLRVVQTLDEVAFVQNLVFYIGRAHRTPDYGIWERGDKTNHGLPELNASSVAMAKAALEAMSGLNLFGPTGPQAAVVHVLHDEIAQARITLEALLPRESSSKEVDAALLSAIGFPAFAVEDEALAEATRRKIVERLEGPWGLARFLRDGHQTVLEDPTRLHYEPEELRRFERIESQWPLFFAYLALDALFRGERGAAERYLAQLEEVAVEVAGERLLPELYYVPEEEVEAERAAPGTRPRVPNANVPLVWAQSLWILARLLHEGLLDRRDLDPLNRHRRARAAVGPTVQLALLAEDEGVRADLAERGVASELPDEVAPVRIARARDLSRVWERVGRNAKLGLTGRPPRRVHSLATSRAYRLAGERVVFLPALFDRREFYLTLDPRYLTERLRGEIAYLHRHWRLPGRPTLALLVTRDLLADGREALLTLMDEMRDGTCGGVPVATGPLRSLLLSADEERIDELFGFRFGDPALRSLGDDAGGTGPTGPHRPLTSDEQLAIELEPDTDALRRRVPAAAGLPERVELLEQIARREGLEAPVDGGDAGGGDAGGGDAGGRDVRAWLEDVYAAAGGLQLWSVVRRAAGLLEKVDVALADAAADLLVAQKHVGIGRAYSEASVLTRPLPQGELLERIREFCRDDIRDRVLTQEVLIYLSHLIKAEPELFRGMLVIRVGHLTLLLVSEIAVREDVTQDEAFDLLMELPPSEIQRRLREILAAYPRAARTLERQESLSASGGAAFAWPLEPGGGGEAGALAEAPVPEGGWWRWRRREGAVSRVPKGFYPLAWSLLERCEGLVIGDKLDRRNRLESRRLLAVTTPGEKNFALRVEHLLNRIPSPEYRQLSIEAILALGRVAEANPDLRIDGLLVLDVLIGHAVRFAWTELHPDGADRYDEDKAAAWGSFYERSPREARRFLVAAFRHLLDYGSLSGDGAEGDDRSEGAPA